MLQRLRENKSSQGTLLALPNHALVVRVARPAVDPDAGGELWQAQPGWGRDLFILA